MKFERIIDGKDHLWAVRDMNKPNNELAALFQKWNDAEYLWDFFLENLDDLQEFFHIERIKLTRSMQERAHTQEELTKLNQCRQFLIDNGVFDSDSFISMIEED